MITLFSHFAGSVYEKVSILGETHEFDLISVKITNDLEVVSNNVRSGYAHLKPKGTAITYSKYVDKNGVLDTGKYTPNFYGIVQNWLNEMGDTFCITKFWSCKSSCSFQKHRSYDYERSLVLCGSCTSI